MANLLELLLITLGLSSSSVDWCQMQTKSCNGKEHIACEPNSFETPSNVRNIQLVEFSDADQQSIIDRHNFFRRKVAKGEESELPSASKMQEMKWNDELAFVAGAHAKHANPEHDQCRSVTNIANPGQNIKTGSSSDPYPSAIAEVLNQVDKWYNDELQILLQNALISCIDNYSTTDCSDIGHLTVMVNDVSAELGCAAVTYEQEIDGTWLYSILTTCDYSGNNFGGSPVYDQYGAPCSKCDTVERTCSNGLCVTTT